jgi:hypothetical protein
MGFFRGALLFIVGVLLLVSLLVGNIFLTLTLSLQYDHVKPALTETVTDLIGGNMGELVSDLGFVIEEEINMTAEIDERLDAMEEYCIDNTEYVFNEAGYTFDIPCEIINSDIVSNGTEGVINETSDRLGLIVGESIGGLVDDYYYEDYDCGFWDCMGQEDIPYFLISEKAHDYWKSKFRVTLIVSLVLIALAFLLVEKKKNFPLVVGILAFVSSLPFMKADVFIFGISDSYLQFLTIFISQAPKVFWIMLIPSLILVGCGIFSHFVSAGLSFSKWIEKRKEEKAKEAKTVSKPTVKKTSMAKPKIKESEEESIFEKRFTKKKVEKKK